MSYTVKLPIFEGPFDLLLHLVRIDEMDVQEIPIAEIAGKYLEYIERMHSLDLDLAGEFLVVASQLLSMKARTLLPDADAATEEDQAEDGAEPSLLRQSPREFMRQLVAYRKFKDLARQLAEREADHHRIAYRQSSAPMPPAPLGEVAMAEPTHDLQLLLDAFSRVLRYVDRAPSEHRVAAENYTVEAKLIRLEELLASGEQIIVSEEFGRCFHKVEMIVTFLAMLEMVRLKRIRVVQDESFGRIQVWPLASASADGEVRQSAT